MPAGCSPRPPSRSPQGRRRSCVWTGRLRIASVRHGSCAWVISLRALVSAPCGKQPSHADSPITQRPPSYPSTGWTRSPGTGGRDQSEQVDAIDRNRWTRSIGTGGRDRPVRAIQCHDVVLPTATHGQIRLRCIARPDAAQAALLNRLGIVLPTRMRPTEINRLPLSA